ncbi:MAG TPA: pyridoxamine 5'-phosphate oxidase family protein, partial [Jatrophihabitantaceae bacterium]|nr:pyridoxamine 5'-phosphate oxidase family protein [Jatrophihabitantaceae bacterium]
MIQRVTRTELTRHPEKSSSERADLDALLDSERIGHFSLSTDAGPVIIPTAIARDGDRVLAHGSTGSTWMRALADGAATCLAVTAFDALVVARSAFESSMHYRSAVIFGRCVPVRDDEKAEALDLITDHLIPGRVAELRRPTAKELAATQVLALPIEEWSVKMSAKWPEDGDADIAGDAWAGVVPRAVTFGSPRPAPNLRDGIPVP